MMLITSKEEKRDMTAERALWYEARDTYVGINRRTRHRPRGCLMALACKDDIPDAAWAWKHIFHTDTGFRASMRVLDTLSQSGDVRAMYFLGLFRVNDGDGTNGSALIRKAALAGYGPAQGWMADTTPPHNREEMLRWARLAAKQDEPEGHYVLGLHLNCAGKQHTRRAATLGHVDAMVMHAQNNFADICPEKLYWMCMAARAEQWSRGLCDTIQICVMASLTDGFVAQSMEPACARKCIYQIGKVFREKCTFFGHGRFCGKDIGIINEGYIHRCVRLFDKWNLAARDAVVAWTHVARRIGTKLIAPDVRRLISRLIWDSRSEASYLVSVNQIEYIFH